MGAFEAGDKGGITFLSIIFLVNYYLPICLYIVYPEKGLLLVSQA